MSVPLCDLSPQLTDTERSIQESIQRVLDSGIFIFGPEVQAFEEEFARYLGSDFAIGVNSGTDALTIALRSLGIGEGDEVIVPSFTFFATVESILMAGARPRFVDIDPMTFNMDVGLVEEAIADATKAIVPVHLYGHACDMEPLERLCRARDLLLVEDVAQATGGAAGDRLLGTIGDASAFSFFPSKNLGAMGDGGMIATSNFEVAEQARMLRAHGARKKYHNEVCGYNSRLDALQAAILRCKLPRLEEWNRQRRKAAALYRELLSEESRVVLPTETPYAKHVYHQFTIRILEGRDRVKEVLGRRGIGCHVYYPVPIHKMPLFHEDDWRLPQTEQAADEVLSLPMFPGISEAQQREVVEALNVALQGKE